MKSPTPAYPMSRKTSVRTLAWRVGGGPSSWTALDSLNIP